MKKLIAVTHFINPHLFWYRHANVPSASYIKVLELEKNLERLIHGQKELIRVRPVLGEVYVGLYYPWKRYIRIRILKYESNELIVWAIDHGFPFQTQLESIQTLPMNHCEPIDHIFCGGVANIMPGLQEYDVIKHCAVVKAAKKWSQNVCDMIEKLIYDSSSLFFVEHFTAADGHVWGDDLILHYGTNDISLTEYFLGMSSAIKSVQNFRVICMDLDTIRVEPFLANDGKKKLKKIETDNLHASNDIPDTRRKVEEWCERNQFESHFVRDETNAETLDTQSIEDVTFEDSVSCAGQFAVTKRSQLSGEIKESRIEMLANLSLDEKASAKDIFDTFSSDVKVALNPNIDFRFRAQAATNINSDNDDSITSRKIDFDEVRKKLAYKELALFEKNEKVLKLMPNTLNAGNVETELLNPKIYETRKNIKAKLIQKNDAVSSNIIDKRADLKKILKLNIKRDDKDISNDNISQSNSFDMNTNTTKSVQEQTQNLRLIKAHKLKHVEDINSLDNSYAVKVDSKPNILQLDKNSNENLFPNATPTSKPKIKFSQLKDPSMQMDVLNNIIKNANLEAELGNKNILNLNNLKCNKNIISKTTTTSSTTTTTCHANPLNANKNAPISCDLNATNVNISTISQKLENDLKITDTASPPLVIKFALSHQMNGVSGESQWPIHANDNYILAHSKFALDPIDKVESACFLQEIHEEMAKMRLKKVFRTHTYSWSHILRGNSLLVVNSRNSGKTWSYLPAICTLVAYRIKALTSTYGPVALILVASSIHVEEVCNYCCRLLNKVNDVNVIGSFGKRNINEVKTQLLNGCGILVATPANLLRLFDKSTQEHYIDPKRLQHVVIDDLNLILSRSEKDFNEAFKKICKKSYKLDAVTLSQQLIVTSCEYNKKETELMQLSAQPLLLIGDFLEAAVYGRVILNIQMESSNKKIDNIRSFIMDNSNEAARFIILCNSDEDVELLTEKLTLLNYACIGYMSTSDAEERQKVFDWKNKQFHNFASVILVCTDSTLPDLQINNVTHLIHYTMSETWTRFTHRFSTLFGLYENLIRNDFKKSANKTELLLKSLILLDEDNSQHLPRLIDFMRKHKQLTHLHADILSASKVLVRKREEQRGEEGMLLCPFLLEFGDCDDSRCEYRHCLIKSDAVSKDDEMPTASNMRIFVLKVYSPTHYAARLLQQRSPNDKKWQYLRRSNEFAAFGMRLNSYYTTNEWTLHWPLKFNDLCIYKKNDAFFRARIMDMQKTISKSFKPDFKVTIKLVDTGIIVNDCLSNDLLVCATEFQNFPEQAVDIRLTGVAPFDNERIWDSNATKTVEEWIVTGVAKTDNVNVIVDFVLAKTVYVTNVIVMEKLQSLNNHIYRLNLKRALTVNELAIIREKDSKTIRDMAQELGLLTPLDITNDENGDECDQNETKNQDDENYQKLANNNNKVNNENKINLKQTTHMETLKKIAYNQTKTITNIYKRHNTENWCTLPLNQIVRVEISDEENGNWSDIYLQRFDNENLKSFGQLTDLIQKHIDSLKTQAYISDDTSWLAPMCDCIVKYEKKYMRAKVTRILQNTSNKRAYEFFLCDYAQFVLTTEDQLLNRDFLYPTTLQIVQFTPYQAVHCKLAGIKLNSREKNLLQITKNHIFAYAVRSRTDDDEMPKNLSKLQIKSYEILLYECDTVDDLTTKTMLNKELVAFGAATLDPACNSSVLDMDIDVNEQTMMMMNTDCIKYNESALNFNELLKSLEASFDLEADIENAKDNQNILNSLAVKADDKTKSQQMMITPQSSSALVNLKLPAQNLPNTQNSLSSTSAETSQNTTADSNETAISCIDSATNDDEDNYTTPMVTRLQCKHPQTKWFDTDFFIVLTIHAPDVNAYDLQITTDTLIYSAMVNGEREQFLLQLLGYIEPAKSSHLLRGLNIVVRLWKSIFMKWPRLLKEQINYNWLKYDLNAISASDFEILLPQQQMSLCRDNKNPISLNYSTDDSECDLYDTFAKISSSVEDHDPTADEC